MKWMGWAPQDLGYRAAMARHYRMAIELREEEAKQLNPENETTF